MRRHWLAWTAGIGVLIAFAPSICAMILFESPVLPRGWSKTVDISATLGMFLIAIAAGLWLYSLWREHTPKQFSRAFLFLAFFTYLVCDLVFAIYARVNIGTDSLMHSVTESLYYMGVQPVALILGVGPFIFLGWLSASVAAIRGILAAILIFGIGALLLGNMYFWGHIDSQSSMLLQHWTAATLSVGLLPFKSIVVLVPLYIVKLLIKRNASPKNT